MSMADGRITNKQKRKKALRRLAALWWARHAQRQALRELETFRLDDLGIGRAQRDRECRKWFWQR